MTKNPFKTPFAERIFYLKYAIDRNDTWDDLCEGLINNVCGNRTIVGGNEPPLMSKSEQDQLCQFMKEMKVVFAGRYLYYSRRPLHFWSNCFCLDVEDTRESWANLLQNACSCLMMGGGIGVVYSKLRARGAVLHRTGGVASGPVPLMQVVNELGRNVQQGGSRRSAIWSGLNWNHPDIYEFLTIKNWDSRLVELKAQDYNWPAPLDMTNISILWDDPEKLQGELWDTAVRQMCKTGEPGFSFNFGTNEVLRNACTEVTSSSNLDSCNLGSINMGAIDNIAEFRDIIHLASKFLICGNVRGQLPTDEAKRVRRENNRIGLGLMGIHEWLLKRGKRYEVDPELRLWLDVYKTESERAANEHSDRFYLPRPKGYRAIAPSGTISILASTTGGIEPLYSIAYKRRYLTEGTKWKYEYVVDATARRFIEEYGTQSDSIETAHHLAKDPERRVKFQYDIQAYVDMAISSTINLPQWGSKYNSEDTARKLAETIAKYCSGLRGIAVYPDGSRGGQPLESVSYEEAMKHKNIIFDESEEMKGCVSGVCSI